MNVNTILISIHIHNRHSLVNGAFLKVCTDEKNSFLNEYMAFSRSIWLRKGHLLARRNLLIPWTSFFKLAMNVSAAWFSRKSCFYAYTNYRNDKRDGLVTAYFSHMARTRREGKDSFVVWMILTLG